MEVIKQRFLDKIVPEPNTGCWLWTGHHDFAGYGQFRFYENIIRSHRVSFMIFKGEIKNKVEKLGKDKWH